MSEKLRKAAEAVANYHWAQKHYGNTYVLTEWSLIGELRDALNEDPIQDLGNRVQEIVNNYDALDYRRKRAVNVIGIIDQLREALGRGVGE